MLDTYAWSEYIRKYKWSEVEKYIKKSNRYLFDNHHFIPVSLWGHDKRYNINQIRRPLHDQIHSVLNIWYNCHVKGMRKIREATNHKLVHTVEYVDQMTELQKQYFSKLHKLPEETRNMHDHKMFDIVWHWQSVADNMIQYEPMWEPEDFHTMHKHKSKLRRDIVWEIQDTLNKTFHFHKK